MVNVISTKLRLVAKYSLVVMFLLATFGCEANQKTAALSGKITLDGKPITQGSVLFTASGGEKRNAASGDIKADGSYAVQIGQTEKLIVGEYIAVVVSREPSTPHPDGGPPTPGALITPEKYGDPQTSGLRYNVRPGENIIDIVLISDAPLSPTDDSASAVEASAVEDAKSENAAETVLPPADESRSTEPDVNTEQPAAETGATP